MTVNENTPRRNIAICERCGEPVDVTMPGVAQHVCGWAVNRTDGGANQIALREPHNRWLCAGCLAVLRSGHDDHQESMF